MQEYKNKNILIIGASFGIGEELFYQLKDFGANLAIASRSKEKLEQMIAGDKNHLALQMDISNISSIKISLEKLSKKWKKIDLIIFLAGIYQPMNIDNFELKQCHKIVDINFSGFINFFSEILPLIKQNKLKHLAVVSSVASYFGMHNSLSYGASKSALSNFVESIYLELKKYRVKVQLINPGFVKTRLTDQNNFKMPMIISAKKAAKIILKELPKNKFEIYFPKLFVLIMKFINLLPSTIKLKILSTIK